jgi:Tfp pilus assembly protein PilN
MAQDFHAAFGLDGIGNDTTINTVDIDGVNMAAIQALEKRTALLQQENEQLKARLQQYEQLQAQLDAVNERMGAMERMVMDKPRNRSVATAK